MKQIEKNSYKDYLNSKKKKELENILDTYNIEYKKSLKKDDLKDLILKNLKNIVLFTLDIFQNDELQNLKLVIKKEGNIKVKINFLLLDFLLILKRNSIVFSLDDERFIMPKEIVDLYKEALKDKEIVNKIKENTDEYNFILSYIGVYGITDFDIFYQNYAKDYKYTKDETINRIKKLSLFYREISFFTNKNKSYIASNKFKSFKDASYLLKKQDYKIYTNKEILNFYNLKFMAKKRPYKRLSKFINKNYNVEKGNFKIINKYVLIPYFQERQLNKDTSKEILSALVDKYFEYNNDRHKEKFIDLIKKLAPYYPSWEKGGHTEKE